ncbi:FIG006285: ICC-like protein phosphoesterase [hydrothermal vent metagenome]|uniref:FIG006285: ICC-like protein phosphoesterase n=1 Tax=hydrothermal vent metagenome TaxID=652676 RepID=A0A3B0QYW4_9ZZZZ
MDNYDELHIISDLHLGGVKNKEINFQIFNRGARLKNFIDNLSTHRPDEVVGLVLNGDIVDFLAEPHASYLNTENAIKTLERIYEDESFSMVWKALENFVSKERRQLVIVLGNHDLELALPEVKWWLREKLSSGEKLYMSRITFAMDGAGYTCEVGSKRVLCLHGNEVDGWNVVDYFALLKVARYLNRGSKPKEWDANAGTRLVVDVMNSIKRKYPVVDLLKPEIKAVAPIVASLDPSQSDNIFKLVSMYKRKEADERKIAAELLGVESEQLGEKDMEACDELEVLFHETFKELINEDASGNVDDLIRGAYENIDKGVDPKKTTASDDTLSWLGDSMERLKGRFNKLKNSFDKEELLRISLKKILRDDDSFEFTGPDNTFKGLDDKVGLHVHYLVAGHTHLARAIRRMGGKSAYYNSGSWIRLIELTDEALKEEAFKKVYEAFGKSDIRALDNCKIPGPDGTVRPLIKDDTSHVVSIICGEVKTYGQLGAVDKNGNIKPVDGTEY